jgi:hypothetical protein
MLFSGIKLKGVAEILQKSCGILVRRFAFS